MEGVPSPDPHDHRCRTHGERHRGARRVPTPTPVCPWTLSHRYGVPTRGRDLRDRRLGRGRNGPRDLQSWDYVQVQTRKTPLPTGVLVALPGRGAPVRPLPVSLSVVHPVARYAYLRDPPGLRPREVPHFFPRTPPSSLPSTQRFDTGETPSSPGGLATERGVTPPRETREPTSKGDVDVSSGGPPPFPPGTPGDPGGQNHSEGHI